MSGLNEFAGLVIRALPFLTVTSALSRQVLKLELKEIREQQDLLFRFMNFLKQEGAVHVLQFCLAVGKPVPNPSDGFTRYIGCSYRYGVTWLPASQATTTGTNTQNYLKSSFYILNAPQICIIDIT